MHIIENKNLIRAFNIEKMAPASGWYECTPEGVGKLLFDLGKWRRNADGQFEHVTLDMFKNVRDIHTHSYTYGTWGYELTEIKKTLCFQNNDGNFVPLCMVPGIYYNHRERRYKMCHGLNVGVPFNRKKVLREKDNGFRKEPVAYSGRYYGRYGRQISYRGTMLEADNPDCKEYGIKGYRGRRVLDAWDIEPVEPYSKSWKKNTKARKQWAKHKKASEYNNLNEFIRSEVLGEEDLDIAS